MAGEKSKILIVDDEPDIVAVLKHFLSVKGYDVFGASNGKDALGILEKNSADLILLDLIMPELGGEEVAKVVKQRYPGTKLIVVTGYPIQGHSLSDNKLLDALFIKPVRLEDLYKKLVELLGCQNINSLDSACLTNKGIKARILFVKARLLFVEPSKEVYDFLSFQFRQLTYKGQNYELELARSEKEIIYKVATFNPDMIIFDVKYFNSMDSHLSERLFQFSKETGTLILSDLASSVSDYNELGKLVENIRLLCIKNGLIEIKWVDI